MYFWRQIFHRAEMEARNPLKQRERGWTYTLFLLRNTQITVERSKALLEQSEAVLKWCDKYGPRSARP